MIRRSILGFIKQLHRPVFTTHELSVFSGKSLSATTQALNNLAKENVLMRIYRGIWIELGDGRINPYMVIPFLLPRSCSYVSFVSALHLYGIIGQIPQVITLASTVHTKQISTKIATFSIHRITPSFFKGFDWYKGRGSFLIAEQEKALVDCLYLSARKKKQFSHFPELSFPKSFSFNKVRGWINKIYNPKIRLCVEKRLKQIRTQ